MGPRERQNKLPKNAWLIVAMLFVVGALNYLDRTMIATMRISIVGSIPMTEAQFGLLTSVFLWVYGISSPFAGYLADKFSRSKVVIVSLFVWSLVTWLTSHATTYGQLIATRALMGVSEAFYIPAALALIMDYHKGATQSLATGLHMCGVMVGQSLGFIGGYLAENHSWHYAFSLLGIIGIAYSVFILLFMKDAPRDERSVAAEEDKTKLTIGSAFKNLFTNRSFIYLFVFWGIMGIVGWLVMAWLPTFYQEQFNLTQSKAGFYATAYLYPVAIVGLLLGGFIADRWSRTNKNSRILVPVIGLSVAVPAVFIGSNTTVLPLAVVAFLVYGLTRNFVDTNLMPILCMVADRHYRATGYGIMNMFGTIIGGVGIYLAGSFRDSNVNLNMIYSIAAASIVICITLLLLVKRDAAKKQFSNKK